MLARRSKLNYKKLLSKFFVIIYLSGCLFFRPISTNVIWSLPTYKADPQFEGAAGTYAGFDAAGKCLDSNGLTVAFTVTNCPFGLTPYFSFNDTRMVFAQTFSTTTLSGWIPDCEITCTNGNGSSAITYVTINIYSGNNNAPIFDNTFPRYVRVTNGTSGAHILVANATDIDTDKTTNGNLTWYMASQDFYSQYFEFFRSTSLLQTSKNIDWSAGLEKIIVIGVTDNPTIGSPMFTTESVTICWQCDVVTGSSSSTSTTAVTTTSITDSVAFLVPVIVASVLVGAALLAGGIVCCLYYCNRDSDVGPDSREDGVPKFANDD